PGHLPRRQDPARRHGRRRDGRERGIRQVLQQAAPRLRPGPRRVVTLDRRRLGARVGAGDHAPVLHRHRDAVPARQWPRRNRGPLRADVRRAGALAPALKELGPRLDSSRRAARRARASGSRCKPALPWDNARAIFGSGTCSPLDCKRVPRRTFRSTLGPGRLMMPIALRVVALLVGLSPAVVATTITTAAGDQVLTGKQLVLRDSPDLAKRSISGGSKDPTITLGGGNGSADDPTLFGGSVRVRTATGDRFDSTYNLPKAGWATIGAPGRNKGYRFTSKTGPIKRVMVKPGRRVKVIGTGAFTATLSTNPNPVDVVLRTGAKRYCVEFGGVATFRAGKPVSAKDSRAPAACPALADWPTYGFDLTRNRFNPQEGLINATTLSRLKVRWFFSTGSGTAAVSASRSVVEGVVYVGSWNGTMYALDAFSGQPLWTFNINDPHPEDRNGVPGIKSWAAVANAVVYFGGADANVYALDAQTGALAWKTSLGDPATSVEGAHVWTSPAVFHRKVYVGKASHLDNPCVRGALVALDAATGAEIWRFEPLPEHICATAPQKPCMTDTDCSGSSCVPFMVCPARSGEQPQTQLCASDADCTMPATCQRPLGGAVT